LPFLYFKDNLDWSHNIFRAITEIASDGGDFGEIYRATKDMRVGNTDDWYSGWSSVAEYVEKLGKQAEENGHLTTAWKCYFRAFNYYRQAQYMLPTDDARKLPTFLRAVECFRSGCNYCVPKIEPVEIPFEGTTLNGYVIHRLSSQKTPGPGLVWFGGADSPAEELFFQGGCEAAQRGLTTLVVNGPGQGLSLYLKNLRSRPDYEKPYAAAFDFLEGEPGVDSNRIGIMGNSLGGYYVLRAAAFEKRARAAVAYGVIYSVIDDLYDYFPPIQPTVNSLVGATSEEEARKILKSFTLNGIGRNIACPVLLVHGDEDYIAKTEAAYKARDEIGSLAELRIWKGSHSIREYHKEVLSYMFDWLIDHLK
jgi:dipeptidyl aminopeptidase/acylaminoacyl peptidase